MKVLIALTGLTLLTPLALAAPASSSGRNPGVIARDLIGGTQTDNPEPCATKCKDGEIMNCTAVDYDTNHTWRCFCHDGAMCMGCKFLHSTATVDSVVTSMC